MREHKLGFRENLTETMNISYSFVGNKADENKYIRRQTNVCVRNCMYTLCGGINCKEKKKTATKKFVRFELVTVVS